MKISSSVMQEIRSLKSSSVSVKDKFGYLAQMVFLNVLEEIRSCVIVGLNSRNLA